MTRPIIQNRVIVEGHSRERSVQRCPYFGPIKFRTHPASQMILEGAAPLNLLVVYESINVRWSSPLLIPLHLGIVVIAELPDAAFKALSIEILNDAVTVRGNSKRKRS